MITTKDFVDAHIYESEDAVIQDALRRLIRSRPDVRIELAVHQYQQQKVSLAKAAAVAGVCWIEMKNILLEKGIQPRLGCETLAEAKEEVDTLLTFLETQK